MQQRKKRNLADWLDTRVRVKGSIQRWQKFANGAIGWLLIDVEIQPYRGGEVRKFDHLWLYTPNNAMMFGGKPERLKKALCVATVVEYKRSDGSFDYGIETSPYMSTSQVLIMAEHARDLSERLAYLKGLKAHFEKENAALDINQCWAQFKADLEETIDYIERQAKLQEKYRIEQNIQFIERRQPGKDPKLPARKLKQVSGFGARVIR